MDEAQTKQVIEGREMIADAKAAAAADEHAASEERVATPGWPIRLADGTEVMAVKKVANPHSGTVVEDADGNQYVSQQAGTGVYVQVENEALAAQVLDNNDEDDE